MTTQYIEVRAISEQHDVQAQRLVRNIVQLSAHRLPSLATLSATPLYIRTASLYHISGTLSPQQIEHLQSQLLVDPVIQEAFVLKSLHTESTQHVVDVFFHAGVTDTLAESVLTGAHMLNISTLERVETGMRYVLDGRLSVDDAHTIIHALLYNQVIQQYEFRPASLETSNASSSTQTAGTRHIEGKVDLEHDPALHPLEGAQGDRKGLPYISDPQGVGETLAASLRFSAMNDDELIAFSKAGLLSMNLDEMRTIQQHYQQLRREPTDVELETLAQTWSEHCSHKTFKATINYREYDRNGVLVSQETIAGLLKAYLMKATAEVRQEWLVSAFVDNAGIVRFTDTHDIAFKVETHNHPSAIEPFGGANTGVGGVIRDVLGVSAQPIACTDILCFGPLDTPIEHIPEGVLEPRRVASGVVDGVRDYGNKMGIPTVNGAILYHRGYLYNPLVFCGCLGILPHGSHPNNVHAGDNVVVLGGRTGRDGVHGATFSSGEMSIEINAQAGTAVQIGAPITEKKVADVIVQARDRKLYSAITDCGAGGFSSAIGEMGAATGVRVDLAKAPLKYQGLAPWEIWLSEAQERMVLAVPSAHLDELLALCAIEEVEASILGTFTDDHRLTVLYKEQVVADMDMTFLHDGRPDRTLEAEWRPAAALPYSIEGEGRFQIPPTYTSLLLSLLQHPSIASKEQVVRRYDHEVQGATVLKPLVGKTGSGPGDASVLQPLLENGEQTNAGVVLSNGVNPLVGTVDPYMMAINTVDEALRNLTAVGGDITRVSILDNFCWGNPTDAQQLGMLVRAVQGCHDAALGFKTPFISGKDSLNNEYRVDGTRVPVLPTLVISAVGTIEDAARTIDMSLKTPDNLLYLVGTTRDELQGSYYEELLNQRLEGTELPRVDLAHAYTTMKALGEAIRQGMVRACHDLSDGGLAVAAAEMVIASQLGMSLDLAKIVIAGRDDEQIAQTKNTIRLFSESPSRFIVEIAPEQWGTFEKHMRFSGVTNVTYIGTVTHTNTFVVRSGSDTLIDVGIQDLQRAFGSMV